MQVRFLAIGEGLGCVQVNVKVAFVLGEVVQTGLRLASVVLSPLINFTVEPPLLMYSERYSR